MPNLTAAQRARLDAQLSKLIRFDGVVRSWQGHIDALDFSHRVEHHDQATGKVTRGLILREEAVSAITERGDRGLAFATYYEAPKLIVDHLADLPLVTVTGYDDVTILQ